MAGPDSPSSSAQSIDLTLNRLINFRKNLNSKLVIHPVNNINGIGDPASGIQGIDINIVKTILEENPEIKKERDSAKFFQFAVIKMLDKIIDEHIQKFFASKQLEKEIMLLEGRLKDSQKTEEDRQKIQIDLNRINSLESLERAKMLMMLNTLQTLNDRYLYLETEQKKSFEKFSQSMLKTLDGVKKDDGKPLTTEEKVDLNNDLTKIAVELAEKYMEKHDNKLEGRRFNEILNTMKDKSDENIAGFKKNGIAGLFLPSYKQDKSNDDIFKRMTSDPEYRASYMEAAKEQLARRNIKDPVEMQTILEKQFDTIKTSPDLKRNLETKKESKIVVEQHNEIRIKLSRNDEKLSNVVSSRLSKQDMMLARASAAKKM